MPRSTQPDPTRPDDLQRHDLRPDGAVPVAGVGRSTGQPGDPDRTGVELLGCVEATAVAGRSDPGPTPTRRRARVRTRRVLLALLTAYGLALVLPGLLAGQSARMQPMATHFGDPFTMNWFPLEGENDATTGYERPPPMASERPYCIGFGRLDWAAPDRSPSVAHCVDTAAANELGPADVAVLRQSIAGSSTWHILLFGQDLDGLDVELDDSLPVESDRVFRAGRFVALLLPNDYQQLRLQWTMAGGERHHCTVPAGPLAQQSCT